MVAYESPYIIKWINCIGSGFFAWHQIWIYLEKKIQRDASSTDRSIYAYYYIITTQIKDPNVDNFAYNSGLS